MLKLEDVEIGSEQTLSTIKECSVDIDIHVDEKPTVTVTYYYNETTEEGEAVSTKEVTGYNIKGGNAFEANQEDMLYDELYSMFAAGDNTEAQVQALVDEIVAKIREYLEENDIQSY